MLITFRFRLPVVVALALTGLGTASAQVFIPDQLERDWLNEQIPGIVDGSGIMDTLHPGLADMDSIHLMINTTGHSTLELHGLQYFHALRWLHAQTLHADPLALTITGFPEGLDRLTVANSVGSMTLLGLPSIMEHLILVGSGSNGVDQPSAYISELPDSVDYFVISNMPLLDWQGEGYAAALHITTEQWQGISYSVPPIHVGNIAFFETFTDLDMSAVVADEVQLHNCTVYGTLSWPQELLSLYASSLTLSGPFPLLPPTVTSLYVSGGSITCMPWLPESLTSLYWEPWIGSPGCFQNWPPGLTECYYMTGSITQEQAVFCSVLNSSCPGSWPGITGRVFMDADADGTYDAGEAGLPQASVVLQPNGNVVGCDPDGTWEIGVQPGSYTMEPSSTYPYIQSLTPAQHTADVPNMGDTDTGNDFAAILPPDIADLRVFIHAHAARPGFDNQVYLTCQNYGTVPLDAELTLSFDGDQTWVGSSVAPATQAGTTATWNFPALPIGATQTLTVDLNTAASVPLGTGIVHTLTASSTATDETPLDNVRQWTDSVVGSFDPNDKLVQPASLTPADVQAGDTPLEYLIRFQNTGTFLAERVLILDTLPEGLVVESIEWLASSHACHWYVTDGVLHVLHENINLPDSTSNEPGSHGFVRFRIQPDTDLVDGTEIVNIAHIVFDFNAPIITPPSTFRVDISTGIETNNATVFSVQPNPTRDRVRIAWPGNTMALPYAVHDVVGHLVLSGRTDANGWIDVGALASGTYLLRVEHNGSSAAQRLVKD